MRSECGFEVEEVGWSKWIGARCLVEPTRLRRVVAVRVEIRADENPLARYCGDPSWVESSECSKQGRRGRECCTVPNVEKQRGGPEEMAGKLIQFDMHIGHVVRDVPVVGCAGEREMEVDLDGVGESRTASCVGAKVEGGSGSDEGL